MYNCRDVNPDKINVNRRKETSLYILRSIYITLSDFSDCNGLHGLIRIIMMKSCSGFDSSFVGWYKHSKCSLRVTDTS